MTPAAFPRTSRYDLEWVSRNSLGENALAQAEALSRFIPFGPRTRVLDLGCGRAISSIFLAREFGAQVWAADKDVSPTENLARIRDAGCAERVFPLRADARELPFASGFFDAALAIDSYHYYGTDERFPASFLRFVAEKGYVGIADIALSREIPTIQDAPDFLKPTFAAHWSFVHTIAWWRAQWERTGLVEVVAAEAVPGGRDLLADYAKNRVESSRADEIARAAALDSEELLLLFTLVVRKI